MSQVPIRLELMGKRRVPVVDLHLKLGASRSWPRGGRYRLCLHPGPGIVALDEPVSVNLPRLFLVDAEIPLIFGREAMTTFNGVLNIDFVEKAGELLLG